VLDFGEGSADRYPVNKNSVIEPVLCVLDFLSQCLDIDMPTSSNRTTVCLDEGIYDRIQARLDFVAY